MNPKLLNPTRASQDRQGPKSSRQPHPRPALTTALRDVAFVLHLTRRVRSEILSEKQEPALAAV